MRIDLYLQEKCARCGDIGNKIEETSLDYNIHYMPPENHDIDALEFPIREPVLTEDDIAPDGVAGHEEILKWIEENYETCE